MSQQTYYICTQYRKERNHIFSLISCRCALPAIPKRNLFIFEFELLTHLIGCVVICVFACALFESVSLTSKRKIIEKKNETQFKVQLVEHTFEDNSCYNESYQFRNQCNSLITTLQSIFNTIFKFFNVSTMYVLSLEMVFGAKKDNEHEIDCVANEQHINSKASK